ncbi:MAG TPA: DNA mismatch repair endonuclease MutL [Candidatus Krumholzibacteria bacterium]|nr:DNA mismatch repair endonuclease MutL [Candidatus Krumholzibacteria bacterium]HPD71561.1 DNA mismatch repair endonuclease MutL [Candidatus Krumholzibacteria bacterium]HRY41506.1 DNA mismatch repair endonuclease MutL [Candidatus Krumholzibacteria bacterium]
MPDLPAPIRVLDDATIDRIAAGEVVERPASIVKELCENALDAGATSISVNVLEGGLTRIVVEDDGHGIPFRELPLAFERHATSKIASAADIRRVGSFGFRGEALAAIASVSRTRMVTRCSSEPVGGLIELDGSAIQRREPAPRNRGTTVTVEDLFYNTPARRKFMKTAQAEKRSIVRTVTVLSLAHWDVRWQLREGDQVLLDLMPAGSLPVRVRDVFGAALAEHLTRFEKESGGFSVAGLASRPTWTRGNREQQFLFVNRRPVESASLSQAIAQAYREAVPPGKHPVVVAFLQLPAGEVDVNVHPAKTEVRLLLERQVFGLLKSALQEGLDLRHAESLRPTTESALDAGAPVPGFAGQQGGRLAEAEADFLRRHFQRGGSAGYEHRGVPAGQNELFDVAATRPAEAPAALASPAGEDPTLYSAPFWQLHRTYIVTQIRGGLVIIDQHNSHERILYNQARQALAAGGRTLPTQQLLFPAHLDLSPNQLQAFQQHRARLETLGFLVQPFGGQSVLVQGIPASLKNWNDGRLLLDVLDDLGREDDPENEQQTDLLASFACHGAVRAGEPLTVPEMQNLVDQLFATDQPLACPHGRPTLINFTLAELEKRFGRRQ